MKSFMLLRLIVVIGVLGSVPAKPANTEAKASDTQTGNEPGLNKQFDFSDLFGNMFGGQGGFFPNTQTGNGQMNGQQQQYPNQNQNQGQQNNPNQWQNRPSGNNFGYPNQGNNNGGFNNNNNQNPWQNTGTQQYPNNGGPEQNNNQWPNQGQGQNNNQLPNQGQGQNNNQLPNQGQRQNPNTSNNPNNLDWKNLYPGLTLNQPQNNNPQAQNPQWSNQGQNPGSNQFQNPGNSPGQTSVNPTNPQQWQNSGQTPSANPTGPQQWQNGGQAPINGGQGPINGGQVQNPNVNANVPEAGTVDSLIPGPANTDGQASSTTTTDQTPVLCQQNCPNTAEYNPVCGNDNVTYNNPGSLLCARNCGLSVRLNHRGRCSGDPANRFMG